MPLYKRWLSYISPRVQTYLRLEQRRVQPRAGHRTVAVSGLIAEQLRQAYGENFLCPVIPPGVVPAVPGTSEERLQARRDLGWEDDACICLMVARNPMRKGFPAALQALEQLPERFRLLVVGSNNAAREHLKKFPALAERVRLVSETSDVAPYYRLADIYIHPTLNDSFGMAPLEAMSYGLPLVISPEPWCGFARYVVDGRDAVLLDHPENAAMLADQVARIDADAGFRAHLLKGARDVVARHSWQAIAAEYTRLYREVLAEKAGGANLS